MKKFFQEYFYYTRPERNGAFALIVLCILLVLAPKLYPFFISEQSAPDTRALRAAAESIARSASPETEDSGEAGGPPATLFEFDPNTADVATFVRLGLSERTAQTILNYRNKGGKFFKSEDFKKIYALREADYRRLAPYIRIGGRREYNRDQPASQTAEKDAPAEPFNFDPNTADEATLQQLGISEKVARVILNYREKGGRFRKKEDLAKIYSLPEADYQRLEPYIQIASSATATDAKTKSGTAPAPAAILIDINKASAEEWQRLRGIGAATAGRIVSYREKLGGFSSVEQVGETLGLPDSTFQHIKAQLNFSPIFKPVAVNVAGIDELDAHPYLSRKEATAIAAYRANHGDFKTFEDVKKVKALSTKTLEKIKPYLEY